MSISRLAILFIAHCAKFRSATSLHASNPLLIKAIPLGYRGQSDMFSMERKNEIGFPNKDAAMPAYQKSIAVYYEQSLQELVPIVLHELNEPKRNTNQQVDAKVRKLTSSNWTQLGNTIKGEAAGDQSGNAVSLSSDGSVLAVGAYGNDPSSGLADAGHVRVYKFNGRNWTQLGRDLDGEAAGDWSGISVSLSSNGTILAIGATNNDPSSNLLDAGYVRVFKFNSTGWTQLGNDIVGEAAGDWCGNSTSLSSDGSVLAVGAPNNDPSSDRANAGRVRVYKLKGSSWTQLGLDIDGEAAGDRSGNSLSLSSDGSVVAVGAYLNDPSSNLLDAGHVRVFKFNGSRWAQLGLDIDGESAGDRSGFSVSLSSDGSVVAIGARGHDVIGRPTVGQVRVFKFNGTGWTQLGLDIDGEAAGDRSGHSVSLSSDGTVLAIGAYWNDPSSDLTDAGHVRVFRYIGSRWTQLGLDIDGEAAGDQSGSSVSLSSDGSVLAVGAYLNDPCSSCTNAGHVRVYQNDFLLATYSPSPNPTKPPTAPPSFRPSVPPTKSPTASPSFSPKAPPSSAPSLSPHLLVTNSTSSSHTKSPTASPSSSPSTHPFNVTSLSPSLPPSSMLQNFRDKSINSTCFLDNKTFLLECSASTNVLVTGVLKTSLVQGTCTSSSPPTRESQLATIELDVNADCANAGTCNHTHCFRSDFVVEDVSVLAAMMEVLSIITFEKDGSFSVAVETSDFTTMSGETNTTVAATLTATLGECGSTPSSGKALQIGETAKICIASPDNVKLSLKSVKANPGNQVLVNVNGEPNFLTTLSDNAESVTLSTLLIPLYFDSQGQSSGSIVIQGTAEISYSARHLVSSTYLADMKEASFGLEVPLVRYFYDPEVAQMNVEEGNVSSIMGWGNIIYLVIAGVVFVLF